LTSSITRALNLPTTASSRLARTRHVLCADFCLHGRPSWRIGSCLCLAACTALELCSSATPPHPAAPAFFHHVFQPSRGEHLGARLTTLSQHHPPSSDTPLSPTRASIRPGGRPAGSRLSWLGLSLVPELPGSRCRLLGARGGRWGLFTATGPAAGSARRDPAAPRPTPSAAFHHNTAFCKREREPSLAQAQTPRAEITAGLSAASILISNHHQSPATAPSRATPCPTPHQHAVAPQVLNSIHLHLHRH